MNKLYKRIDNLIFLFCFTSVCKVVSVGVYIPSKIRYLFLSVVLLSTNWYTTAEELTYSRIVRLLEYGCQRWSCRERERRRRRRLIYQRHYNSRNYLTRMFLARQRKRERETRDTPRLKLRQEIVEEFIRKFNCRNGIVDRTINFKINLCEHNINSWNWILSSILTRSNVYICDSSINVPLNYTSRYNFSRIARYAKHEVCISGIFQIDVRAVWKILS